MDSFLAFLSFDILLYDFLMLLYKQSDELDLCMEILFTVDILEQYKLYG